MATSNLFINNLSKIEYIFLHNWQASQELETGHLLLTMQQSLILSTSEILYRVSQFEFARTWNLRDWDNYKFEILIPQVDMVFHIDIKFEKVLSWWACDSKNSIIEWFIQYKRLWITIAFSSLYFEPMITPSGNANPNRLIVQEKWTAYFNATFLPLEQS